MSGIQSIVEQVKIAREKAVLACYEESIQNYKSAFQMIQNRLLTPGISTNL